MHRALILALFLATLIGCAAERAKWRRVIFQAPCGNGRIDPGELCDFKGRVALECPSPWTVCKVCTQTCDGFQLRGHYGSSPEVTSLSVIPPMPCSLAAAFTKDEKGRWLPTQNVTRYVYNRYGEQMPLELLGDLLLRTSTTENTPEEKMAEESTPEDKERMEEMMEELVRTSQDGLPKKITERRESIKNGGTRIIATYKYEGVLEERIAEFDARGSQVYSSTDERMDGSLDYESFSTLDAGGKVVQIKQRSNPPLDEDLTRVTYDSDLNVRTYENDSTGDGLPDYFVRYEYEPGFLDFWYTYAPFAVGVPTTFVPPNVPADLHPTDSREEQIRAHNDGSAIAMHMKRFENKIVSGSGYLEKETIRAVIRSHLHEVRHCYLLALDKKPTLTGRVKLKLIISPDGSTSAHLMEALEGTTVGECVAHFASNWVFPSPGDGVLIVNYPFLLSPE